VESARVAARPRPGIVATVCRAAGQPPIRWHRSCSRQEELFRLSTATAQGLLRPLCRLHSVGGGIDHRNAPDPALAAVGRRVRRDDNDSLGERPTVIEAGFAQAEINDIDIT